VAEAHTRREWFRPPRQARSRETLARILDAAEDLLTRKSFDDLSVSEIVRAAGSSVGSFYSRFRDKDALLEALRERQASEALARIEAELELARWQGASLAEIARECIALAVRVYRSRAGLNRALLVRGATEPAFGRRAVEVRRRLQEQLAARLLSRREQIRHPDPEAAADFALDLALSLLERRALTPEATPVADDELAAELTRVCLAYLGTE
jgi:AcrR family transcriptional regulator